MFRKHQTRLVFGAAVVLSVLTIGLLMLLEEPLIPTVIASAAFNCWALVTNDRKGFSRSKEMRRAYEPERHFTSGQILFMIGLLMLQVGAVTYVLVS